MFLNRLRQIARTLTFSPRSDHRFGPAQRTTWLQLETLEARLVLATHVWDGGAVSNNWTNATNWVGNVAPVAGDDLVFPAGVSDKTADNTYDNNTIFKSITLGGGYTLRGNRVNLGTGGIIDNSGTSDIIKLDIILGGASRTIIAGTGSTLFIDGAVSGGGFIKLGSGDVSLRANNTYGGLTEVAAGRLFVTKDQGLGSPASGTTVKTGAQLIADHSATLIGTLDIDEPLTLAGGSKIRALRQVELNGSITLLGTADISQEAATEELFIDGQITGPGGLNLIAQNKLTIRGSDFNTYTGTTSVTGDVRLGKSDAHAIGGDLLIIEANSSVTLLFRTQFDSSQAITIRSGGKLRLNGHHDSIRSLNHIGGEVNMAIVVLDLHNILSDSGRLEIYGSITATSTASGPSRIDGHIDFTSIISGAELIITVADGPSSTDLIVDGLIETMYANNLVKEGAGLLELSVRVPISAFSSFTGHVVVNAGTLLFNSHLPDNSVLVNGGRLSGTGEMFLMQGAGGIIAPGPLNSPGILNAIDGFDFQYGNTFIVRLNGPVAGTGHDQVDAAHYGFIMGSSLLASIGGSASPGDQFRIINYEGSNLADLGGTNFPTPGFLDPSTGNPISQGATFTTAAGHKLSMNYFGGTGNDVVLTYVNTRTLVENLVVTPETIVEGGSVLVTGHLTDPDLSDQLTLLVNWGDGTPTATLHPGRDPFALSHEYRDNGDYTQHLTWFDNHGEGNSRDLFVTVLNVPPQVSAGPDEELGVGGVLNRIGSFTDPGKDRWTAMVDYGDGSGPQPLRLRPNQSFVLHHRYLQPGTFTVIVTVRDDDGDVGTASFNVIVQTLPNQDLFNSDLAPFDAVEQTQTQKDWHNLVRRRTWIGLISVAP